MNEAKGAFMLIGVGQQQQEYQLTWNGSVVVGVWAKVHLPFFNDP